jgi:hypothetical protein
MKHLLFLLSSLSFFAQGQESPKLLAIDPASAKYSTSGVVQIDTKARQILIEGAYKWLSEIKFASSLASKGIIMEEAIFGKIVVSQYFISRPESFNTKIRYVLTLEFRDGRFRYQFTEFSYLLVAKRKDFEEVTTSEDKILLQKLVNESNGYISSFISEITAYLTNYVEDNSW